MKAKYAFALVVCALAAAALVQAAGPYVVTANIPFEFTAANKLLPAGEYEIVADPYSGNVILRCPEAKSSVIAMVRKEYSNSPESAKKTALVFHRYGNEYFLSRLENIGQAKSYVLPQSASESRLANAGSFRTSEFVAVLPLSR